MWRLPSFQRARMILYLTLEPKRFFFIFFVAAANATAGTLDINVVVANNDFIVVSRKLSLEYGL